MGTGEKDQFLKLEIGQIACYLGKRPGPKTKALEEIDGTKYLLKKGRLDEDGLGSLIEKIRKTDEQAIVTFDVTKIWKAKGNRRFFEFLHTLKKEMEEQEFCILSSIYPEETDDTGKTEDADDNDTTDGIEADDVLELVKAHPLIVSGNEVVKNLYSITDPEEKVKVLKESVQGNTPGNGPTGRQREPDHKILVNAASDAILIATRTGRIIECNKRFLSITGLKREEIVGKHMVTLAKRLLKIKSLPTVLKNIKKAMSGEKIDYYELEYENKILDVGTTTHPSRTKRRQIQRKRTKIQEPGRSKHCRSICP